VRRSRIDARYGFVAPSIDAGRRVGTRVRLGDADATLQVGMRAPKNIGREIRHGLR
jgi:hypothetical protein